MTDKHTKGQMDVVDDGEGKPFYLTTDYAAAGDICDLYHRTPSGSVVLKANARNNADRIALTWNCHDDLLEALEGTKQGDCWCGMGIGNPMITSHTPQCVAARAAIAKARNTPDQGEK